MQPVAINAAEAVIEPFWDTQLSGLSDWDVADGGSRGVRGLKVSQNWCWVNVEWSAPASDGPTLSMSRTFDLACGGYDTLLLSIMPPAGSIVRLTASTDSGERSVCTPPAGKMKQEVELPLDGAARVDRITIDITAAEGDTGYASGWINWLGLQSRGALDRVLAMHGRSGDWPEHLHGEDFEPTFTPAAGLLMSLDELDALRARHEAERAQHGRSIIDQQAELALSHCPEDAIASHVNFWTDTRYNRVRDHGRQQLTHGINAAVAGVILRDKALMRHAARWAMSLAHCTHWDDGMICTMPGSAFEHRCFVQSLVCHEVAIILDLAGEMFTNVGRDFCMRRLAEEGLGCINFNTWKHEYIFHNNQLAWFTPGRMYASALLEKRWPRVRPYTDIAFNDLVENLTDIVLPDGGYVEGPTYFRCVARDGGLSLFYYARARGESFDEVVPDSMRRTADFIAALESTTDNAFIPICDAGANAELSYPTIMAALLPNSRWTAAFHKTIARAAGGQASGWQVNLADLIVTWQLADRVPADAPPAPPIVKLPVMGPIASTRMLGGRPVKLLLQGNKAGAGHTHEDKGSFVLEFAGDTFAVDLGTCDYSSPFAAQLKQAQRHNMLVPIGMDGRPGPKCPLPVDLHADAQGDERALRASLDVTPGWEGIYARWHRSWDSPTPDRLTIRDEWKLDDDCPATGAAFLWQTRLPVHVDGNTVTVAGEHGTCSITAPADTTVSVVDMPLPDEQSHRCIRIEQAGRAGVIEVQAELEQASD